MDDKTLCEKIKSIVNRVATNESPYDLLHEIGTLVYAKPDSNNMKPGTTFEYNGIE